MAEETGTWHEVATMEDFAKMDRKYVEIDDDAIGIFRADDGNFYAVSAMCTHQRVSLMGGDVDGTCIMCPLHGAEFELKTGDALCPPAYRALDTYELKIEGETFLIKV